MSDIGLTTRLLGLADGKEEWKENTTEINILREAAARITGLEAENKCLTAMVMSAQHALDEVGAGIARRVAEEREACAQIADRVYPDNAAEVIRARPSP